MICSSHAKAQEVLDAARTIHKQAKDWVVFFREVLGVEGVVRKAYPTAEALLEFQQSSAYRTLQYMLQELRDRPAARKNMEEEPQRVITVRLPKSLHKSLVHEAHDHRTSLNQLCINKLLQAATPALYAADYTAPAPAIEEPQERPRTSPRQHHAPPFKSERAAHAPFRSADNGKLGTAAG